MPEFQIKRIYDDPSPDDGMRLLVDRLWPRGVSKEAARIDLWAKELAPSHELRKWFHDHPDQQAQFAARYQNELQERSDDIIRFFASIDSSLLTLVTSTRDLEYGHVAVLKVFLMRLFKSHGEESVG